NTGALYVFNADGSNFLGGGTTPVPFATTTSGVVTSPCVGDVDGVPGNEIVFSTANGTLYAFHANGTEVVDGDSNPLTNGVVLAGAALGVRAQPVLADLDGSGGEEIIIGSPANSSGFSILHVIRIANGTVEDHTMLVGGDSQSPAVVLTVQSAVAGQKAAIVPVRRAPGDFPLPGLYIVTWELLTDPQVVLDDLEGFGNFVVAQGQFSSPVAADLDGDGYREVVAADDQGKFHAFHLEIRDHIPGDYPVSYLATSEPAGWPAPFPDATRGRTGEISVADLERDGHPEVFQTGQDSRVVALYWSGAPRKGYPVRAGTPLAPADSAGTWAPLIADVDGDGVRDVIPILPDGRRPAYRGDGTPIPDFNELGSTGVSAPPILADLDGDGFAEWIETFDAGSQVQVSVKAPALPVAAGSVAWGQYRLSPTRNAVVAPDTAGAVTGTQNLSSVFVYPNPSHDGTSRVHYRLQSTATSVSIRIFDTAGSLVADLPVGAADLLGSSEHSVPWNQDSIASGVYVCRVEVQSGGRTEVKFTNLAIVR
ncbi:MAG: T9SS type A sorting domain-containing protein, partial [Bacteroidota bacterium]